MKKIIKSKVYNTETANKLAEWESDRDYSSLSHYEEALYRKKTGEYFLCGQGGAMTKYAKALGENNWSGGGKIIPLSYQAAREWAEEHLDAEKYESLFGAVEEDDSKTGVTFRLPASTVELLKRKASEHGAGMSDYLDAVLSKALSDGQS